MAGALLSLALSGLGRDALKVAAGLTLAVLLALAFAVSALMPVSGVSSPGHSVTNASLDEIPPDQLPVMRAAAASCGLPWPVLAAVAKVESDFGRNMATSWAGAIGYGQFLPSSWAAFGQGGDPYNFRDALPAMARYLCAHGGARDIRQALWAYNHSWVYVDQVMTFAARFGSLSPAPSRRVGEPGKPLTRAVELARAQLGKPYVWGGASPATSFDCSGLVQWAYAQAGLALPRTAQQQFDATLRLTPAQLQPGDLVFFARTYPSAEPITHVGIYLGGGRMLNAASAGVHEANVFSGYWGAHYAGAGRVRR